jgi:putative selenate reductase
MALTPQPFAMLLARMLVELEREGRIFDLPRRSFWRGHEDFDLSVTPHGTRASNPAGPAAGPHTQLAQNLVLAWLAGARNLELKTVQVLDRLTIPRPCIDAPDLGFNVEWSQELRLEQSLEQYLTAWCLIHILIARGVNRGPAVQQATRFEASVGYDLDGIRSAGVARFLDGLADAGAAIARLRAGLPHALRPHAEIAIPERACGCVTLSTFHGCPADQIERIVEHLIGRHGVHVVVKLNPTLLGYEATEALLRGQLGYDELHLDRAAFDADIGWAEAVTMLDRLSARAARAGVTVGAKLTNTLVIRNPGDALPGPVVYLSGPPLHVLAMTLADRLARATGGRLPLSFSAGIDADNFAAAVSCGMSPVTACTDLLRPTGYRRLPRYLKALEAEMERHGAHTIADYVLACAEAPPRQRAAAAAPEPDAIAAAAQRNLAAYAARLPGDPRYHAAQHRARPRRLERRLQWFDCESCNACVVCCPNDAFFSVRTGAVALDTEALEIEGGVIRRRTARFEVAREEQWVVFADFCNECGNCDTFCPELGGPYRLKPRCFGSRAGFDAASPADGVLIEAAGARMLARIGGVLHRLERGPDGERFDDGVIEAVIDAAGRVVATRALETREGHRLSLERYHALRLLRDATLASLNPVSAAFLPLAAAGPSSAPAPRAAPVAGRDV